MRNKDFYERRRCLCRLNETVDIKGMKHSECPINGDHWACCDTASLWSRSEVCPQTPASRTQWASGCLAGLRLGEQRVSLFFP